MVKDKRGSGPGQEGEWSSIKGKLAIAIPDANLYWLPEL